MITTVVIRIIFKTKLINFILVMGKRGKERTGTYKREKEKAANTHTHI